MQCVYSMFVTLLLVLQAEAVIIQGHTTLATKMEGDTDTGTVVSHGAVIHHNLSLPQGHQSILRRLAVSQCTAT